MYWCLKCQSEYDKYGTTGKFQMKMKLSSPSLFSTYVRVRSFIAKLCLTPPTTSFLLCNFPWAHVLLVHPTFSLTINLVPRDSHQLALPSSLLLQRDTKNKVGEQFCSFRYLYQKKEISNHCMPFWDRYSNHEIKYLIRAG